MNTTAQKKTRIENKSEKIKPRFTCTERYGETESTGMTEIAEEAPAPNQATEM